MKKFAAVICIVMLAGITMVISSCGGAAGTAPRAVAGATISGTVTDADVSGADVSLYSTGSSTPIGTTTTDANGDYSFADVNLRQYGATDMLYVIAEGGSVNGADVDFLKFKSILGSGTELQAAGADGTVNAADIPDLTVSNVTTAKVALVEAVNNIVIDPAQNNAGQAVAIMASEKDQEDENMGLVISMAGMIKAAVDNSTNTAYTDSLGEGQDISEYVKASITVGNGGTISVDMDDDLETAGAALEAEILADDDMVKSAAGSGGTTVSVESSDIAGTWYGYHVDTWGQEENMGGPGLVDATLSTTGGNCSAGQIYMVLADEVDSESDAAGVAVNAAAVTEDNTKYTCGKIVGDNILNFGWTEENGPNDQQFTLEASGKIEGNVINGTFTMKDSTGKAVSGGIFKLGKDVSADYSGTYDFKGEYTVLYLSDQAEQEGSIAEGDSSSIVGSFTITSTGLTGSIQDQGNGSGTADDMVGELDGPRVKAKLSTGEGNASVFLVFLVGQSEVTGLYMDFSENLDNPDSHDAYTAGKFRFETMAASK